MAVRGPESVGIAAAVSLMHRRHIRAAVLCQQFVDAAAFLVELGERLAVERLAAGQADAQGIDAVAVDDQFVMQMRSGRQARRADPADYLALHDFRAGGDILGDRALVIVGRNIAIGVADQRLVAIAAGIPAGFFHDAVAGRDDRRAARGRPVNTGMHARKAEDRMAAHAETGAERAVRNGVAQQELADALALLVVIVDRIVVGVLEPVEARLGVAELGIDIEQF